MSKKLRDISAKKIPHDFQKKCAIQVEATFFISIIHTLDLTHPTFCNPQEVAKLKVRDFIMDAIFVQFLDQHLFIVVCSSTNSWDTIKTIKQNLNNFGFQDLSNQVYAK